MKKSLAVLFSLSLAGAAFAQRDVDARAPGSRVDSPENNPVVAERHFPVNPDGSSVQVRMVDEIDNNMLTNGVENTLRKTTEQMRVIVPDAVNLTYHGGDVINTAHLVFIFWGPTFNGGSDAGNASALQAFRDQFGTSSHYSMLTQYSDGGGHINTTNLHGSQADWFDTTSALPSNGDVTDAIVQAEVNRYLSGHGASDNSTVYEVVLPKYVPNTTTLVYSSDGSSTSCGGPGLAYGCSTKA